jgi:hypothetical protein
MVSARIEMLHQVVALITLRPQRAESITLACEHDACNRQAARPGHSLGALRYIDEPRKQLPG